MEIDELIRARIEVCISLLNIVPGFQGVSQDFEAKKCPIVVDRPEFHSLESAQGLFHELDGQVYNLSAFEAL